MNAKHLNGLFTEELRKYEYNKKYSRKLCEKLSQLINENMKENFQEQTQLKKLLAEVNSKMEKLEKRFIGR